MDAEDMVDAALAGLDQGETAPSRRCATSHCGTPSRPPAPRSAPSFRPPAARASTSRPDLSTPPDKGQFP
jgi:hypothetical protein